MLLKSISIVFLLLMGFQRLAAQDNNPLTNQPITLHLDTATAETVLEKLIELKGLYFSFNPELLPTEKRKIEFVDTPLHQVLKVILPDSSYKISLSDKQFIITKIEPAPVKVSGKVVEPDGKTPLVFAAVTIEDQNIGTMTNRDGDFDLNIPRGLKNSNLLIRTLGFKEQRISPDELLSNPIVVLQPVVMRLREIRIKPADPRAILQQFRENISKNYESDPQLMVIFYRETARQDGSYIGVWEAVMEMMKGPYTNDDQDRIRFLKGRMSDLKRTPKEVQLKMQGGPWNTNKLDVVKTMETFLSPEYENLYSYHFEQPEDMNGKVTWIIRFDRKEEIDLPCFTGRFMIDAETFALVKAEFSYDKKSLRINGDSFIQKEPNGFTTRPESAEYSVQYRQVNGKWQFHSAHSDLVFRVKQKRKFKTEYRNVTDVLVTQQFPFPKKGKFGQEGLFHESDIFSDKIGSYDRAFWGDYNVIKPDDDLSRAIRESSPEEKKTTD